MPASRPFIPSNKPRSWVIAVCSGLSGLGAGGIAIVSTAIKLHWLKYLAFGAFVLCWIVLAFSGLVFMVGLLSGRYRNIASRPWNKQVW